MTQTLSHAKKQLLSLGQVAKQACRISVFRQFKYPEKIEYMVVHQLDACTFCPDGLKPNIRGCLNVQIGLGELVGAQLVTLSYSPKFRSQMGINRSCIQHIALDNSPQHFTLLRGVQGGSSLQSCRFVTKGSTEANSSPLGVGGQGAKPPFLMRRHGRHEPIMCQERQEIRRKGQCC